MHIVEDRHGKKWDLTLTLGSARRVDASDFSALTDLDFSILNPKKELFTALFSNPAFLGAVAYAIVQPQVKGNLGIDPIDKPEDAEEAFVDSFDGAALSRLKETLWGAMADFFPDQKTALCQVGEQMKKASLLLNQEIEKMLPELDTAMEQEVERAVAEMRQSMHGAMSGG